MSSLNIYPDKAACGAAAGKLGAEKIRTAIAKNGFANIIIATGASQFEMLQTLVAEPGIDWTKVTMFHLDEYVGLAESHPASFRKYIKERFVANLPAPLKAAYFVNGSAADPKQACAELGETIAKHPIDVAFIGIGETDISHSTIPRRILIRKKRTWWWIWMMSAANSSWAKAGSPHSMTCRNRRSP